MRATLFALALAACSSAPREELPPPQLPQRAGVDQTVALRAEGVQFYGHGESFTLRIYADRIALSVAGAEDQIFPRPEPQIPRWSGAIYDTSNAQHRLSVAIRDDRPCPSGTGDRVVELLYDGAELRGCGRRL
ncbi:MAG: hypothetical protein H7124_04400 [Phycisphaerales bacterium]|nr:hypothetical protein [Hyphomonadaceae bacterium]